MCTRFRAPDPRKMQARFGTMFGDNQPYNPNVAPTDATTILRTSKTERKFELAKFGLVPSWSKDKKTAFSMLNARRETVREKPAYRDAYKTHRCIVPANGFYEWREEDGKKQPYYFSRKDGELILFAGLWTWASVQGEEIFSFTIVTGEPNALVAPFHDRMPVITDAIDDWLDLARDPLDDLAEVPLDLYVVRPVNPAMNKPTFKELKVIDDW